MSMVTCTVPFPPTVLKRHRHRKMGGTYDPSRKEKDDFVACVRTVHPLPTSNETRMSGPLRCELHFVSARPKSHFRTGQHAHELKPSAPAHNTDTKDVDNMIKFVLDALNGLLYHDDRQMVEVHAFKEYHNHADRDGYIVLSFATLP